MIAWYSRKGAVRLFTVALFAACMVPTRAQDPVARHRIQAVITDLRTPNQARQIDILLRYQDGVLMTRTDYNTRNLLMEVTAGCTITEEQIRSLLAPHAMSLKCYSRTTDIAAPFVLLDPRTCAQPVLAK